jgi:hypothetical protein
MTNSPLPRLDRPGYVLTSGWAVQERHARGWQTIVRTKDHPARAERVFLRMKADKRQRAKLVRV